jgi:CheY-like chemotaxis protein
MLPPSDPAVAAAKKKRVLLIDTSRAKRDLRSETMRKLGIDVDCAADISEARCWWRADLYDLVLIHVEDAPGPVDRFCSDLRTATPPQQVMFLVGGPSYLSSVQGAEHAPANGDNDGVFSQANIAAGTLSDVQGAPRRWGIMEACRRISAVRSMYDARSKAIRNRPEPRRDSETSRPSRMLDPATFELIREELQ